MIDLFHTTINHDDVYKEFILVERLSEYANILNYLFNTNTKNLLLSDSFEINFPY